MKHYLSHPIDIPMTIGMRRKLATRATQYIDKCIKINADPRLENKTKESFVIPQHCCAPRAYELHNPRPKNRKSIRIRTIVSIITK